MPRSERPLESGDSGLLRFAADLRQLRDKAGRPTYRRLSEMAHYSAATLSQAAAGHKLPSLAVTLAYVRACDGDVEEWRERWHTLSAEAAATAVDSGDTRAPYVGLGAFQEADAERFFGREHLLDALLGHLARQRVVAVFGASGGRVRDSAGPAHRHYAGKRAGGTGW